MHANVQMGPHTDDVLAIGRSVLRQEARALDAAAAALDPNFVGIVEVLHACSGHVVVMGVGKSGHIGRKISATFASIGTASFFVHATEAIHGDLGRIRAQDVVLALSNSGETAELVQVLAPLRRRGCVLVALTSRKDSTLGRAADWVLATGPLAEACPLGLAPTVSAQVALGLGDALAMALFQGRGAMPKAYAQLHPGGALGRRLRRVAEVMRVAPYNPVVRCDDTLRHMLAVMTDTPGRPGAACVVDADGRLVGLFTDGDLRRLVQRGGSDGETRVVEVMHRGPRCIGGDWLLDDAAALMQALQVDQLPVVDAANRPLGLLDVQDVLAGGPALARPPPLEVAARDVAARGPARGTAQPGAQAGAQLAT